MVTIKDVAKACGVSQSTVSKALNGYKEIGAQKAQEICKCAEEMGYFPNSAARSLKTNRSYNIGIVFADQLQNGLKHGYFSSVLNSFKTAMEEKGYSVTFISEALGNRKMTYAEQCKYRNFDGVMVACADYDAEGIRDLAALSLPLVTIDYEFDSRSAVVSDNFTGMYELTKYVLEQGHRNIAYIHGENTNVTKRRLAGFHKAFEEYGITPSPELIRQARYRDPISCAKETKELLKQKNRPTCILYPDDYACLGAMNVIHDAGLQIPNDISVAGYDGSFLSELLSPRLTTLRQNTVKIGQAAAEKLLAEIESPRTWVAETVKVIGELLKGETVLEQKM